MAIVKITWKSVSESVHPPSKTNELTAAVDETRLAGTGWKLGGFFAPIPVDGEIHPADWQPTTEIMEAAIERELATRREKQIENERKQAEYAAAAVKLREETERKEAAKIAAYESAMKVEFVNGVATFNLYERLEYLSKLDFDRRFAAPHIRRIDAVNETKKGWYVFEGEFIKNAIIEFKPTPAIYAVASTSGSAKHHSEDAVFIKFDGSRFTVLKPAIETKPGWELIEKSFIKDELAKIGKLVIKSDPIPATVAQTPDPLRAAVLALNVNEMSPIDALTALYELKRIAATK